MRSVHSFLAPFMRFPSLRRPSTTHLRARSKEPQRLPAVRLLHPKGLAPTLILRLSPTLPPPRPCGPGQSPPTAEVSFTGCRGSLRKVFNPDADRRKKKHQNGTDQCSSAALHSPLRPRTSNNQAVFNNTVSLWSKPSPEHLMGSG